MSVAAELAWFRELRKYATQATRGVQLEAQRAVAAYLEEQKRGKSATADDVPDA